MPMGEAELDDRGRVVIPGDIRRRLGWEEGQRMSVEVVGDSVVLRRRLTMQEALDRLDGVIGRVPARRGPRMDPRRLKDIWTEKLPKPRRRRRARR